MQKTYKKQKSPLGNDWCSREFDPTMAKDVGVDAAIMYRNIVFWCEHNKLQGTNLVDGKHWTYRTRQQLADGFSFWTVKQVQRILTTLVKKGYIIKGNFNKKKYDKTIWYTYS